MAKTPAPPRSALPPRPTPPARPAVPPPPPPVAPRPAPAPTPVVPVAVVPPAAPAPATVVVAPATTPVSPVTPPPATQNYGLGRALVLILGSALGAFLIGLVLMTALFVFMGMVNGRQTVTVTQSVNVAPTPATSAPQPTPVVLAPAQTTDRPQFADVVPAPAGLGREGCKEWYNRQGFSSREFWDNDSETCR